MHPVKVHAILLVFAFINVVVDHLIFYKEAVLEIRKEILEERITKQHFIAFRVS